MVERKMTDRELSAEELEELLPLIHHLGSQPIWV